MMQPKTEIRPGLGIYKIKWKKKCGGGKSVGAIYMDSAGTLWLAPSNWIGPAKLNDCIKDIKKLIRIEK